MAKTYTPLNESQRKAYIKEFWDSFETLLVKKRFSKLNNRTKWKSKDGVSIVSQYGIKKLYVLESGNKQLSFSVEARPFLWTEGTIWVEVKLEETKNLVVSQSKMKKAQGAIYKPDFDPFFFLTNTSSVVEYIQTIELTPLDVSLFDSIPELLKNLLK